MAHRKAAVDFEAHTNTPRKTVIAASVCTTEKRVAAHFRFALYWTSVWNSLSNQLERSGTSIGANIREAKYAHSKADFIAKLQISLKECYETEYWLEIAHKAEIITFETAKDYIHECGSMRRMLIASLNTAKDTSNLTPSY